MSDLTVEILKEIRDELRNTNGRLDGTNQRLERLEKRQTETEVRLTTELTAVVGAVHELRDVIVEDRKLRSQVSDHENRIGAIEKKIS